MTATPFQYSAVTALGASRLGVPARVVVGARPGPRGIVRQTDVFSWVELQLADGTWRTLDPERYTGVHRRAQEDQDDALAASAWVAGALDLDPDDDEVRVKIPKGADIELSPDAVIEGPTRPGRTIGLVLRVVVGLLLLASATVPLAKVARRRRRRSAGGWSAVYVHGWQEVLDTARDRGTPVPEGWSRVAQATALGHGLALARRADAAVFAPGPADDDAAGYWRACQGLRHELLAATGRRQRWWSYVNPASLVAGWARDRSGSVAREVGHEDRGAGRQQPTGA